MTMQTYPEAVLVAEPKPGQMWAWTTFTAGNGSWLIEYVTEERRSSMAGGRHGLIKTGDTYTIVTLDDPGPYDLPDLGTYSPVGLDELGNQFYVSEEPRPKRWHTALLGDAIFWLSDDMLAFSELVRDVE